MPDWSAAVSLTMDEVIAEADAAGWDCLGVVEGTNEELFEAGLVRLLTTDDPQRVIKVARFEHRTSY
jgi:hypothetical protein